MIPLKVNVDLTKYHIFNLEELEISEFSKIRIIGFSTHVVTFFSIIYLSNRQGTQQSYPDYSFLIYLFFRNIFSNPQL